jgi:hypothetical protein
MKPSEAAAVLGAINPQSATDQALATTGTLNVKYFDRFAGIVQVGAIATGGTVNAKMQVSTDNSSWTDVTGTSITALTDADDNKQVWINLTSAQAQTALADADYIRLAVTTAGGAAALVSAVLLGFSGLYRPASDHDVSSVDEIVN